MSLIGIPHRPALSEGVTISIRYSPDHLDSHRTRRRHRPTSGRGSEVARLEVPTARGEEVDGWGTCGVGTACGTSTSSEPSSPITGSTWSTSPITISPFFVRRRALFALCSLAFCPRCPPPPPPPGGAPCEDPPEPCSPPRRPAPEPSAAPPPLVAAATGAPGGDIRLLPGDPMPAPPPPWPAAWLDRDDGSKALGLFGRAPFGPAPPWWF